MAWLRQARVDVFEMIMDVQRLNSHQTRAVADAVALVSSVAGTHSVEGRSSSVCARGRSMTWLIQRINLLGAVLRIRGK